MTRTATLRTAARRVVGPVFLLAAALSSGCAALTNPVADGIPVRRVPAELLARPKSELRQIPLPLLRRKELTEYRLDRGDVLAIIAGDLFGPMAQQPPVHLQDQFGGENSIGYPVPVRDDGTISLPDPRLPPIHVRGKTVTEVEELVRRVITSPPPEGLQLFPKENARIGVQLLRRRRVEVQVVREDTVPFGPQAMGAQFLATARRGAGFIVQLEYGKNDVLRALNATGGLPGLDARNEVIIQRGGYDPSNPPTTAATVPAPGTAQTVTIPLRIYPDQPLTISEEDIILNEGDIIFIQSRDSEVYYTGGIVGSRQIPLPRDYDLDVLAALAVAGAPLVNGGFTQNAFVPQAFAAGLGNPSPTLVTVIRRLPDGRQFPIRVDVDRALVDARERILIQPDDFIIMQEKPYESIVRYLTQQYRITTFAQIVSGRQFNQTFSGVSP
jgi:hypothetical protein